MFRKSSGAAVRTPEQRLEHYRIERALADRLRTADRAGRRGLYSSVYDELFRSVPDHPQLARVADAGARSRDLARQMAVVGRFLRPGLTYLELGPGDCAVALEVARNAGKVYAVEVSEEITRGIDPPPNFELLITDGAEVPVPPGSVDLIYSNQLMEHLHPEDAAEQLANVARAMKPGGRYVCITPNALSGPHDISGHYDDHPTGFHLREYTVGELVVLFRGVGFTRFRLIVGARGVYLPFTLPVWPVRAAEWALARVPPGARRWLARSWAVKPVLGVNLVATR